MYQQGPFYHVPNNQPSYNQPSSYGPLPLGQAVKHLFRQYCRVFISPGRATFAREMPKAAWNIVWVQIISFAILLILPALAIFDFVIPGLLAIFFHNQGRAGIYGFLGLFSMMLSLGPLMFVPLSFFVPLIIQYFVAKMLGGRGKLVQHGYARALITMPVLLLSTVIGLVPILEIILFPLEIYAIILSILMIMEVHRINGIKATITFFSPYIVGILFAITVYLAAIGFMFYGK